MRRILFLWTLLLVGFLCLGQSDAFYQSRDSNYNTNIAGVAGFQGPGDITSGAIGFWSAGRAYNLAYANAQSPLADLVDTGTGLAVCTLKVGTNGFANLTAVVCPTGAPVVNVVTFCTVTHPSGCSITKLYDQTGTGNHVVQAILASMPLLTFSAQNGLPCASGGPNILLTTVGTISQSAPYSYTAVAERTGSFTTGQNIITFGATTPRIQFRTVANGLNVNNGANINLTANDSVFHAAITVASATAPLFAIDSSANTSTATSGTTALSSNISLMAAGNSGTPIIAGFFCEAGIWPADLNSSYQAMLANMRSATSGWNF